MAILLCKILLPGQCFVLQYLYSTVVHKKSLVEDAMGTYRQIRNKNVVCIAAQNIVTDL